jgi:hypothetical protein
MHFLVLRLLIRPCHLTGKIRKMEPIMSEFVTAAKRGDLPKVQRMLREGTAGVTMTDEEDCNTAALALAIMRGQYLMALWLVEHEGASMIAVSKHGSSVWDCLIWQVVMQIGHRVLDFRFLTTIL